MLTLSNRTQLMIGAVLVLLLVVTRGQHAATLNNLPGASWAVFFLAAVYLRPVWVLPALLVFVWGVDFFPFLLSGASLVEIVNGGEAFCLTPSYFFLLPAYSALWLGGRWYASQHRFEWRTLLPLVVATLAAVVVCQLFSSGGFYFFSGRFVDPTLAEFSGRFVKYFPQSLQSIAFYIGLAAVLHTMFTLLRGATGSRRSAQS